MLHLWGKERLENERQISKFESYFYEMENFSIIGTDPQSAWSVQRRAAGWTALGSSPGAGEIFRTRPDRLWDPPNRLYKW